ncbi:MvdC/MvdD family ATP grasp protein [Streptomyces otsuchiensis]|uniref:MvdC/MvdD family ATP grasp protein n=1 Tax=Streptomyces otsuchiensis TaxID=2681388 RepID=UPI001D130F39|nr:RimK domain-containing protein [Streptomyces otsuchiensis]
MMNAGTRGAAAPRVLVLTTAMDPTADQVLRELNTRGVPFWRTDLAAFPALGGITAELRSGGYWDGRLEHDGRGADLGEVRAVWWRKPRDFSYAEGMTAPEREFATSQTRRGLGGVLGSIPAIWVNHPSAIADCTKPRELAAARAAGLDVPETLITTDPAAVAEFGERVGGRIITKVMGSIVHKEAGTRGQMFARRVPRAQWSDPRISLAPHLFQREVTDKRVELRVTVVGEQLFTAAIHAPPGAGLLDWRADSRHLAYSRTELPPHIAERTLDMLHDLGLIFATLDFIVDADGTHYLIDVNSCGQWAWIPQTREPITQALADLLQTGTPS